MNARDTPISPLMTIAELAEYLRISRSTVYRHVEAGTFEPVKIGGRTLFRRADIDAIINKQNGA